MSSDFFIIVWSSTWIKAFLTVHDVICYWKLLRHKMLITSHWHHYSLILLEFPIDGAIKFYPLIAWHSRVQPQKLKDRRIKLLNPIAVTIIPNFTCSRNFRSRTPSWLWWPFFQLDLQYIPSSFSMFLLIFSASIHYVSVTHTGICHLFFCWPTKTKIECSLL